MLELNNVEEPCHTNYRGPEPISESESTGVADWAQNLGRIWMYISLHAFGQRLLLPYGHQHAKPADYDEIVCDIPDFVLTT